MDRVRRAARILRLLRSPVAWIFVLLTFWNASLIWNLSRPLIWPYVDGVSRSLGGSPARSSAELSGKDRFVYERLGITAPLRVEAGRSPLTRQDWPVLLAGLRQGVVLTVPETQQVSDAPYPDRSEPTFVVGHSSDYFPHPYAAVFAGLIHARPGDTFSLERKGVVEVYTVTGKTIVEPTDAPAFTGGSVQADVSDIASGQPASTDAIRLVTCWPPLSTKKRLVVTGERLVPPATSYEQPLVAPQSRQR
jgi:LPXTG-site transpeptidase (sortase) family protein